MSNSSLKRSKPSSFSFFSIIVTPPTTTVTPDALAVVVGMLSISNRYG